MGLFDLFNVENNRDSELEQNMNNLDLEEWQKELVREGKQESEDFEEDDSEDDDDYYCEDE